MPDSNRESPIITRESSVRDGFPVGISLIGSMEFREEVKEILENVVGMEEIGELYAYVPEEPEPEDGRERVKWRLGVYGRSLAARPDHFHLIEEGYLPGVMPDELASHNLIRIGGDASGTLNLTGLVNPYVFSDWLKSVIEEGRSEQVVRERLDYVTREKARLASQIAEVQMENTSLRQGTFSTSPARQEKALLAVAAFCLGAAIASVLFTVIR